MCISAGPVYEKYRADTRKAAEAGGITEAEFARLPAARKMELWAIAHGETDVVFFDPQVQR